MLTKNQRRFVLRNRGLLSAAEMARRLAVPVPEIERELGGRAGSKPERPRNARGPEEARDRAAGERIPAVFQALACAAVVAAAVLVNLPTLQFGFLNWDDPDYVVNNPWIRSWSRENLVFIFTQPYLWNFLPLHLVSYMLDYSLWGLNPFGYHLHSVLLNGLNAALALVVVRRLFGSFILAFLAALLFAVHPSHVEAVAWISIRKDLLSTLFLLLSLFFYLRSGISTSVRWGPYLASVLTFTLGLLSKVTIVVLPLFLLLVDFVPRARKAAGKTSTALWTKIPYLVVGVVLTQLNSQAQVKAEAAYAHDPLRYLMVKGHAVWNYLALLTGIRRGAPNYDTPQFQLDPLSLVLNVAGILVLPALLWIAYRYRHRVLTLGIGWILTLLVPAIAFPLVTYMADRYLYAPSLGFCWILAAGIVGMSRKWRATAARVAAAGIVVLVGTGFAYRTLEYNRVWSSSESLWSHTMARSKDFRVYTNLAQVRINQKRYAEAESLLMRASQIEDVTTYRCLTVLYYETGRYDQAHTANEKAFQILAHKGNNPEELAELHYLQGAIYWIQSKPQEAIASWEAALRANPRHAQAREWLQTARGKQG